MLIEVNKIIDDVFSLYMSFIDNKDDIKPQIEEFIRVAVNGDTIKAYLPIKANLQPQKPGILLYVLTNVRLIKFEIDKDGKINSSSFFLKTMTNIERKSIDKDNVSVDIVFQNLTVGLSYPVSKKEITEFFQTVETAQVGI